MKNKAMEQALKRRRATDLSNRYISGTWYSLDFIRPDMDYCNAKSEEWIWSIGIRKSDGKLIASTQPDLYENPEFECVWLR